MSNNADLYSVTGESIAVLRKKFVVICDDNHCAAMILDIFSAREAAVREFARYDERDYPPYASTTIAELSERTFGMFAVEIVKEAFDFLLQKKYITYQFAKDDTYIPDVYRTMNVLYERNVVQEAYRTYGISQKG
jgi:hypothetical protein